jgi:hypothetical protein
VAPSPNLLKKIYISTGIGKCLQRHIVSEVEGLIVVGSGPTEEGIVCSGSSCIF